MAFSFSGEFYPKYNVELELAASLALIDIPVTQGNGLELDLHLILTHNIGI